MINKIIFLKSNAITTLSLFLIALLSSVTWADDTLGLFDPATQRFLLKTTTTPGVADITVTYTPVNEDWQPVVGDWDGDGVDTVGLYDSVDSRFHLRNSNNTVASIAADMTIPYGPSNGGWQPVVGDWDGDGVDTVGLYDPVNGYFYLSNSNTIGTIDITFAYGSGDAGQLPVVGDWDGDGMDTVGLYDPVDSRFNLRNSNSAGAADIDVVYESPNADQLPVVGDWNGDGIDTIGLYNPVNSRFSLRNSNSMGAADINLVYGPANTGWLPVAGQFAAANGPPKNGVIVDNTDPGFTTEGSSWSRSTLSADAYGDNYEFASAGAGSDAATWRVRINAPGEYDVFARWPTHATGSPGATYAIINNGTVLGTVQADQGIEAGRFNFLGRFSLAAGTLDIRLARSATGAVAADAIFVGDGEFVEMTAPQNLLLETGPQTVLEAAAINFPVGWGIEFIVKDLASGAVVETVVDFDAPYKQFIPNLSLAEYLAEIHIVNPSGVRQPVSLRTRFGVGDYYVALGDSITAGSGDKDSFDNVSADGRNESPGYTPILNDRLTATLAYPHTVINKGKSGHLSKDGVAVIDTILAQHPKATHVLIQYGTNDARSSSVPSGEGLNPNNPGYAGSFKANMQQIIDAVFAAGKIPLLAKVPISFGTGSNIGAFANPDSAEQNLRIQAYNRAIDELVSVNALQAPPPDFYNHFRLHPEQMDDNLHPNGAGYRAMAGLWLNALTAAP